MEGARVRDLWDRGLVGGGFTTLGGVKSQPYADSRAGRSYAWIGGLAASVFS